MTLGILFAFLALLSWGIGDFFVQRAARAFGDLRTLFYIGATGAVVLFPFVTDEFFSLAGNPLHFLLLTLTGVVIFAAAMLDFEALRRGKIAVIEPILGLELPVVIALTAIFWGEHLSLPQGLLAGTTFVGIVLAVTKHHTHLHYHTRIFERGVVFALAGSILMGLVNFLVGASAQETSPLLTIWFTNTLFTALCLIFIAVRSELPGLLTGIIRHPSIFIAVSIFDNAAWLFYALATSLIAISIATTISESYIALAVLLGLFVNREKLKYHQFVGVGVAILSIILLAATL
ncbi:MAG: DMT family transporter [Patescibacteria group bacterium]